MGSLSIFPEDGQGVDDYVLVERALWLKQAGVPSQVAVPASLTSLYRRHYPILSRLSDFFVYYDSIDDVVRRAGGFAVLIMAHRAAARLIEKATTRHQHLLAAYFVQDTDPLFFLDDPASATRAPGLMKDRELIYLAETEEVCLSLADRLDIDVRRVRPGIDRDLFHPSEGGRDRPGAVRLTVASHSPEFGKHLLELASDLKAALADRIDIRILGPTTKKVRKRAKGPDRLWSHSELQTREQVARLLRESDIFVDPWDWQGGYHRRLEALACGCALVVSSAAARDLAIDRKAALTVNANDLSGCRAAVAQLATKPEMLQRMQRNAARIAAGFTGSLAAQSDITLWRSVTPGTMRSRESLAEMPEYAADIAERSLERLVLDAHQRQDFDGALRLLRNAIDSEQARPSAWLWLSRTYLALDDLPAAHSAALAHLRENPNSLPGKLQLANILHRRGQRTACIELLNEMLPRYRRNREIVRSIILLLLAIDAYDEASAAADVLLRLCPGDEIGIRAKARLIARDGHSLTADELPGTSPDVPASDAEALHTRESPTPASFRSSQE